VPWSIHVFKLDRLRRDFVLGNTLGNGDSLGLRTVSDQLKKWPATAGTPLAAVNGDFYINEQPYAGDPRDLQIHDGELVSAPAGHACFWMDAAGEPQSTNVVSRFHVTWSDGSTTPFGLNEARDATAAVLYTAVNGPTTRTRGGLELTLERAGSGGAWLPLRAGRTYQARVRTLAKDGNAPLDKDTLVLSLGPRLLTHLPPIQPGATLKLSTETFPDLSEVHNVIGGGPTLVHQGRAMAWPGIHIRHPRTAVGWNKQHLFLVEVDGRQLNLSLGMTLPELANYMVKLGCTEAMNLDGGGSATMWVYGNVMNSPSEGSERPGANSLVIYRKSQQATVRQHPEP
jgi:Phosphodiester glycosidase